MKLKRIVMQGFRSFQAEQVFDFSALQPGLYHLHGKNISEPWLEANGVGKSNLFEAVHWCLYGTTSRRQRGNSLKNWFSNHGCHVILELETGVGNLAVFRQQGPNVLEVSVNDEKPHPVEQPELETMLGMSSEAFMFGIFQAQFEDRFLDLQPAKQMAVFTAVRGLDLWERASTRAAARNRELEVEVSMLRSALARLEGQAQALQGISYDKDEADWKQKQDRQLNDVQKDLEETQRVLISLRGTLVKYKEGSKKFRDKRDEVQRAAASVGEATANARRLEKQRDELKRKDLKNCPTCGTPIKKDRSHLEKELERLEEEIAAENRSADDRLARHDVLMREMAKYRDSEVKLLDTEKSISGLASHEQDCETNLKRVRAEENPFTTKRAVLRNQLLQLKRDLEANAGDLAVQERKQVEAQYWVGGFKQVRLMLVKESLAQLEAEANESLFQLGLREWALEFDVERETKSGTIDRNFNVNVRAPKLKESQPWEAWCGGESQRLRLAGTLGFSNLICSTMGVNPNVEFWDEPTAWLSGKGIADLLEVLAHRAQSQRKIILLADHRVLQSGAFNGTINVIKDDKGSRIE